MAQKVLVLMSDDLDPDQEATDTIRFGIDGQQMEIDLSEQHINEMRELFAKYIGAGRKVGGGSRASARSSSTTHERTDVPKQVRAWAESNGVTLSTRGRIAAPVLAAFEAKDVAALKAAVGQEDAPATPAPGTRNRRGAAKPAPEFSGASA